MSKLHSAEEAPFGSVLVLFYWLAGHKSVDARWGLTSEYGLKHKHKDSHMLFSSQGYVGTGLWMWIFGWLQRPTHTVEEEHLHAQKSTKKASFYKKKKKKLVEFWCILQQISAISNLLQQWATHTNSRHFHTHITPTRAFSIHALTIGSLCWAGLDVRMNQYEDSWLDMPIHLPKKSERKREWKETSGAPEQHVWLNCFTDPLKSIVGLWNESRGGWKDNWWGGGMEVRQLDNVFFFSYNKREYMKTWNKSNLQKCY